MTQLPIEIVKERPHLVFRWKATATAMLIGPRQQTCEGELPHALSVALKALIEMCKSQEAEITRLRALLASVEQHQT